MAHFAKIDENGVVLEVHVINNSDNMKASIKAEHPDLATSMLSAAPVSGKMATKGAVEIEWEDEQAGKAFCEGRYGGTWVQTSYNGSFRKQYAGTGYTYDAVNNVFITPRPFKSWELDKNFDWQPPVARPGVGNWKWDEKTLSWTEIRAEVEIGAEGI
jgi:hypothetical protein